MCDIFHHIILLKWRNVKFSCKSELQHDVHVPPVKDTRHSQLPLFLSPKNKENQHKLVSFIALLKVKYKFSAINKIWDWKTRMQSVCDVLAS